MTGGSHTACPQAEKGMENKILKEENKQLKQLVKELQSRLEKLENQSSEPPSFAKQDKKKRRRKPGRKHSHKGYSRPIPDHIDEEVDLSFDHCPDCEEKLSKTQETFSHYVEDIQMPRSYVKKYTIHGRYCSRCNNKY